MAAVTDSFDRADSATTMGNADSGQTWVPNSGVWGISSNEAYRVSGLDATTVINSTLADCTVQLAAPAGGIGGLCWRSTDSSNFFMLSNTSGTCWKIEGGGWTSMGDGAAFASGDTMTVVLSGNSHTIKKNGSTEFSFTSAFNQSATKHGLYAENGAWGFNNFSVTSPAGRVGNAPIITQAVRRASVR